MQKRCPNCFEVLKPQAKKCPHCGVLLASVKQDGLSVGSLLRDRYFVGQVFKKEPAATVYLGYDQQTDGKILIREFTAESLESEVAPPEAPMQAERLVERFVNYGKSMAAFSLCKLLPRTVDVFAEGQKGYMVLEWFEGQSLKELLTAGIRISQGNGLKITEQLCEGLKILHNAHMIFGALSPDTLYILKDGTVRLFGLGSPFFDFVTDLNQRVELLNPSYAAPELFDATAQRGAYSDVYSVAAILYRILTDTIPPVSFLRSAGETLRAPRRLDRTLPRSISVALLNALNWQVVSRTKKVERLLGELPDPKVKRRLSAWILWANILGMGGGCYQAAVAWTRDVVAKVKQKWQALRQRRDAQKKRKLLWLWITLPCVVVLAVALLFLGNYFWGDTPLLPGGNKITSSDGWYYGTGDQADSDSSRQSFLDQFGVESERQTADISTPEDASSQPDDGKIACPDLVGYYKNYAFTVIEQMNLQIGKITEAHSEEHSAGYIMGQGVTAGTRLEPGSPISLVISKGSAKASSTVTSSKTEESKTVTMPDLKGKELLAATDALNKLGLKTVEYQFESGTAQAGTVVAQSVEAKKEIDPKTKITLTVIGREIKMPALLELSLEEALDKATDLTVTLLDENQNTLELSALDATQYTVADQSIASGTVGYAGMAVELQVKQNTTSESTQ